MIPTVQSASLCTRGLKQACYPILSQTVSKRWHCQDTTSKKIEAVCYFSGRGSFFSNYVSQEKQIFIPSSQCILCKDGIYRAEKPSNSITVKMNEMDTFDVETPLVPIHLTQDAVDEFQKVINEKEKLDEEIFTSRQKMKNLECKIENMFSDFSSKIDEKALSYM